MTHSISAHYDGQFIVPDEPVRLPIGRQLRIRVELAESSSSRFAELLEFASDLPDAPSDLSTQHDHYLYGTPKK